jgi:hypothetical protein
MDSQQHDLVRYVLDAGFPLNAASLIHLFVGGSQLHGAKVSGYDDLDIYCYIEPSQRMRLTGERGMGRHGQRPDLIERYGFDVKFAMHYVHLLGECRELLREHKVTLPRPEKELLIDIRTGNYTQDQVFEIGDDLAAECEQLFEKSDLPDAVNAQLLSQRIADAYQYHWRQVTAVHATDD